MERFSFLLLFALCSSVPLIAQSTDAPIPSPEMEHCELPGVTGDSLCGWVEVPADHADPGSASIRLRVVILPASAEPSHPDPVFYLAGGPGASAIFSAGALSDRLRELRPQRDLVFIDQRGTGDSVPYNCRMTTSDGRSGSLGSQSFPLELIEACSRGLNGLNGSLFTTWRAADDLAVVADRLGYDQLNLYGVSYGTRLGLVFLNRHPERVRTLTVQSVVLPSMAIPLAGTLAAQASLDRLLSDCAADARCAQAFPNLSEQTAKILSSEGEAGFLFNTAIAAALYDPRISAGLPEAIANSTGGQYQPLLSLARGTQGGEASSTLSSGAYLAVLCAEDVPFLTDSDLARAAETMFTDRTLRGLVRTCGAWSHVELPEGARELPSGNTPVLLIAGELDPVTSADQARLAADQLTSSRLVVLKATGHSGASNDCAINMLIQFIEAGDVGVIDAICADRGERPEFQVPDSSTQ